MIHKTLSLYGKISLIPGFFNIIHVRNRGAIFGMFSQSNGLMQYILLMAATTLAMLIVVYFYIKTPYKEKLTRFALSLVLAGALGNFVDRIFKGYVIDFLDFYIKKWHWATFNVADSCITIGAVFLIGIFLFKRSDKCIPSLSK